jgi:hypothetical protein
MTHVIVLCPISVKIFTNAFQWNHRNEKMPRLPRSLATAMIKSTVAECSSADLPRQSGEPAWKLLHQCRGERIRNDIDVFSHHRPGFL